MTALDGVLGKPGDPLQCRTIAEDISIHWWPRDAKPGDRCLCGERIKNEEQ